ncbi:MAG: calcium-translocating P-type ATPase, SERCA-type [Halanaerobiales bacterium]
MRVENFYTLSTEKTVQKLQTHLEQGLSDKQVKEKLDKYGENKLEEKAGKTIYQMILDQFKDFLILTLIAASIISIILAEYVDGGVILGIVVLNAILGIVQEKRASNALKALKDMAAPKAKVVRNGSIMSVESSELVPGDLVVIEAGDYIPADLRLIESVNLKVEEAALTGESVPVEKDSTTVLEEETGIGDRVNSAFMSTIVTYGRGKGIVSHTGMNTEIGKIASMLNDVDDEQTPLQRNLASFGRLLGIIAIGVCIFIFLLGLIQGEELFEIFMTAISLAVAAIPEGLPAVVTVVLAVGMQRMIKRHAIIKRLGAVETLGSTTVICTDKTGTLTQNKMTVTSLFDGEGLWDVQGTGYSLEGDVVTNTNKDKSILEKMMLCAVLCNDAKLKDEEVIGDPTEGSLIVLGGKAGYDRDNLNDKYPRLDEFPFDSDRKLMSTRHNIDNKMLMFTKGAPDVVLSRSKKILINNKVIELTEEHKEKIIKTNKKYAEQALRVLGFAYKEVKENAQLEDEENDLILLGLVGMIDPPREEAKKAVALCKGAGIRVVMITGDHKITASAIAKELGIIEDSSQSMEGKEIKNFSEDEFKEKVNDINVFARVSPEHKVRIVEAIKSNNDIAAMTGDGVNDAPALKRADIGIAMGINGTDVSKEAADMILTDDNFASIVDAVEEGRIIYSNIRKFVGFLLSCNIGEILIILVAMLLQLPVPLVPIQLLWINLVTDSFPAFALGMEVGEKDIMKKEPRDPGEPIVDNKMKIALALQSIGLALGALVSFYLGYQIGGGSGEEATELGRTFCFTTLILGEMLRAYSARSEAVSLFKMKLFNNRFLNLSVIFAVVLLLLILYVPFLQPIFETTYLSGENILLASALSFSPILFGEVAKKLKR